MGLEIPFEEGCAELFAWVGDGHLTGHVVVDQVYAHSQHEDVSEVVLPQETEERHFKHPHGGGPHYLSGPLLANLDGYMLQLTAAVLPRFGQDLEAEMMDCMEDLAGTGGVETYAPSYYGNLRLSGHPFVTVDGVTVRDRPPAVARETDAEINAQWTLPDHDWRWD